MTVRMAVVIDYQNVHLTAAQLFLPGRPIEESLIDPFGRVQLSVYPSFCLKGLMHDE